MLTTSAMLSQSKPIAVPLPADDRTGDTPILYVYPAATPRSAAVVMCPGGGYSKLAMGHEGHDMAEWFNGLGITYAVLQYRLPHGDSSIPFTDACNAMRLMRSNAEAWHIDPARLGIMGASAGGHLASTVATKADGDAAANFQILLYPVISMADSITHRGSRDNLLGASPRPEAIAAFSSDMNVSASTPPAFIALSADDRTVPVENSIRYFKALNAAGTSASLHIYPEGGHGWGFNDSFPYKSDWTSSLRTWLAACGLHRSSVQK